MCGQNKILNALRKVSRQSISKMYQNYCEVKLCQRTCKMFGLFKNSKLSIRVQELHKLLIFKNLYRYKYLIMIDEE